MAKNIDVKVTKKSSEKNWSASPKDKNQNRHTIDFAADHVYGDEDDPDANDHAGTSVSLNTTNQKLADSYKIGDTHTLSLKKK